MINLPRRGQVRRLGLTLRWQILCPTIAEYDAIAHGGLFEKLRILRRIRRAGPITRVLCAREIAADLIAQFKACAFPTSATANGDGESGIDSTIKRFALELTRSTGISPRDQYETLTPLELTRLLAHCSWVQVREDRFYAAMTARGVIPEYPTLHDPARAGTDDQDRMRAILAAWAGREH